MASPVNNTVSIDGYVYVPLTIAVADRYPTGGALTVSGALEVELETEGAFWHVYHERDFQSHEITSTSHTFNSFEFDDTGAVRGLAFGVSAEGEVFLHTIHPDFDTAITIDSCPTTVENLAREGPDIEYLAVEIDCPQTTGTMFTTSGDEVVGLSVRGSLRVQRQEAMQTFSN